MITVAVVKNPFLHLNRFSFLRAVRFPAKADIMVANEVNIMRKWKHRLRDALFMLAVLLGAFGMNLFLQSWFDTRSMIP